MQTDTQIVNRPVEIRHATEADLSKLVELSGELGYPATATDLGLRLAACTRAGSVTFVAREAGVAVGWVQVGTIPGLVEERSQRILGLVVSSTMRGKGIGRALVEAAEDWARKRGARALVLSSNIIRKEAHQFYEHLGFTRTKTQHLFTKPLTPLTPSTANAIPAVEAQPATERVFHVSDRSDIARFEPRPPPSLDAGVRDDVVWGIADRLLHNYLLPRDCPRVTFYAGSTASAEDVDRLLAGTTARHVVAIETAWLERVRSARLWLYELPPATFRSVDASAGYLVSNVAVTPIAVTEISDVLGALAARAVEFRILPSLWKLRDAVLASTLAFSFIRIRHAQPRA